MGKLKPYRPDPYSLAGRAIEFFTTNPNEELTSFDLAIKFDKPAKQVHSLLAYAVDSGALERTTNDDDEIVYRLGTGAPEIAAAPHKHPTLLSGVPIPPKRAVSAADVTIDLQSIQLRDDVPVPLPKRARRDWDSLLQRMKVGQSCELPIVLRGAVNAAVTKLKRKGGGSEFALRQTSDDVFGLWRVK